MIASLCVLSACSSEDTAGTDAVAIGGTFQFHSPGGQTEIFYDEADRAPVKNISGESLASDSKISLDDYKDQIVVLNAWGQWCAPCRSESDDLQTVQEYLEKEKRGTVLGINVRDYSKQIAQDFVKDNGLTYPSLYDPPFKTAAQLGGVPAAVVPTTIILDKQHRPAAVFLREITAKDVIDVIEKIA
nr:TlpA disulfide reductase family protein [Corynebacterium ulcerans]